MELKSIKIEPKGNDYTLECDETKKQILLSHCIECRQNRGFNLHISRTICEVKKNGNRIKKD